MKTQITAHSFPLTPALKEHIETQFLKLDKFNSNKPAVAHVVLHAAGHGGRVLGRAEARFTMLGKDIFAEAMDADVYAAADALIPKLLKQMEKVHGKTTSHRHTPVNVE